MKIIKKKYNPIDWSRFKGRKCTDMGDTNDNALDTELDKADNRQVTDYHETTTDELIK